MTRWIDTLLAYRRRQNPNPAAEVLDAERVHPMFRDDDRTAHERAVADHAAYLRVLERERTARVPAQKDRIRMLVREIKATGGTFDELTDAIAAGLRDGTLDALKPSEIRATVRGAIEYPAEPPPPPPLEHEVEAPTIGDGWEMNHLPGSEGDLT